MFLLAACGKNERADLTLADRNAVDIRAVRPDTSTRARRMFYGTQAAARYNRRVACPTLPL